MKIIRILSTLCLCALFGGHVQPSKRVLEEDVVCNRDREEVKEDDDSSSDDFFDLIEEESSVAGDELIKTYKRLFDLVERTDSSDKFLEKKKVLIQIIKLEKRLQWLYVSVGLYKCDLNKNLRINKADLKATWNAYIKELEKDEKMNQAAFEREELTRFDDQQCEILGKIDNKSQEKTPRFSESEIKVSKKEKMKYKKHPKFDKYWKKQQYLNQEFDKEDTGPSAFDNGYSTY